MSVKLHHRRSRAALVLVVAFVTLLFGISINQYSLLRLQRDIAISGDLRAVDNLEKDAAAITVVERDMSVGSGAESQNTSLFLHDGSPVSPLSQQIQRLYGIIPEAKVHHLQKRYDVDDYNRLVQRGQDLFCLMSADINTADQLMDKPSQSTWTDYGDLEKYGYTVEEQQNSFRNLQKYAAVGEALSFGIDYVRNQDISIEHSEEWIGDNGEENRPTDAECSNLYNTEDGIIIAADLMSAKNIIDMTPWTRLQPPPLAYFSDITFLQWASLHGVTNTAPPVQVKPPRYIIIDTAINNLFVATVNYIKNQRGVDTFGDWPGQKFTTSDQEFYALLATPNCYGTAWFVIQHKAQMGRTAVTEITVWNPNNAFQNYIALKIEPVQSTEAQPGNGGGGGGGVGGGGAGQPKEVRGLNHNGVAFPAEKRDSTIINNVQQSGGRRVAEQNVSRPLSTQLGNAYDILPRSEAHKLQKAFDDGDYQRAIERGRQLACLLEADATSATNIMGKQSQSTFTDFNDVTRYGYVVEQFPLEYYNVEKFATVASSLGFSINEPEMSYIKVEHLEDWTDSNGEKRESTSAHVSSAYNIQDGVIIVAEVASATTYARITPRLIAPPLTYFSDLTFLQWAKLQDITNSALPAQVKPPKYVIIDTVVNPLTNSILNYVSEVGNEKIGPWPGLDFVPGQDEFYAILSSPNVYGTAWLLIQHKEQMGVNTITNIKAWGGFFNFLLLEISPVSNPTTSGGSRTKLKARL